MDSLMGSLGLFAAGRLPSGWMECDGRELPALHHQALAALIGNRFGGDGHRTIALPDLRGRAVIGANGVSGVPFAGKAGEERHALTADELPQHTHAVYASGADANTDNPVGGLPAKGTGALKPYAPPGAGVEMALDAVRPLPAPQPHENRQPHVAMVWAICVDGIFPDRGGH